MVGSQAGGVSGAGSGVIRQIASSKVRLNVGIRSPSFKDGAVNPRADRGERIAAMVDRKFKRNISL